MTVLWQATLVSTCPPRTKKNSGRIVRMGAAHRMLPSAAYEQWEAGMRFDPSPDANHLAMWNWWRKLTQKTRAQHGKPVPIIAASVPINCCALVYRDAARGDACGYYQAIGDALEAWGIIANDKWIVSWDGSRLLKDAANPRVEVVLSSA